MNLLSKIIVERFARGGGKKRSRGAFGTFAGAVGLACNAFLFAVKLLVGLVSGSLAIIADAINNLSDAGSSAVTVLSFKLSGKPADNEHPFGHARIEYLSGAFIAIVIEIIGTQLLKSSVEKIITPASVEFSAITFGVLILAVLVKFFMRNLYIAVSKKIDSTVLLAAASDSLNDMITTSAVLACAVFQYAFDINLDGYVGAVVAVFIIISGLSILKRALNPLIGEAPDQALIDSIYNKIMSYPGVLGLHDLLVHSYGPATRFATVHVEMSAEESPLVSHGVLDDIERDVESELGVKLVIHLDPVVKLDDEMTAIKNKVVEIVASIDEKLEIHDFRAVRTHNHIKVIFDVAVPTDFKGNADNLNGFIAAGIAAYDSTIFPVMEIDRAYRKHSERK